MLTLVNVAAGLRPLTEPPRAVPADRDEGVVPAPPLGRLVWRPAIYRRNGVAWCLVRSWRADLKRADVAALKSCKATVEPTVIAAAGREIAGTRRLLFGRLEGWLATLVSCGHSRRSDCFGKRAGAGCHGGSGDAVYRAV
jgi:hypothetical protein